MRQECRQWPYYVTPCVLSKEFGLCPKDSEETLKYFKQRTNTIIFHVYKGQFTHTLVDR